MESSWNGSRFKTIWGAAGDPPERDARGAQIFFSVPQMVLTQMALDPCHEDSEYVLGFEIGQRKSGFYSEQTESQTDRITESQSHPVPY